MSEYGFVLRCVMDTEETVFRDVLVRDDMSLLRLHQILLEAFSMVSGEMATFYSADDDWNPINEFPMFDFEGTGKETMENTLTGDVLDAPGEKLVWVADLLMMKSFLLELVRLEEVESKEEAQILVSIGTPPEDSFDIGMESDELNINDLLKEDSQEAEDEEEI